MKEDIFGARTYEEMTNAKKTYVRKLEGTETLRKSSADERVILKWILKERYIK
jgi:hypothetical protein